MVPVVPLFRTEH